MALKRKAMIEREVQEVSRLVIDLPAAMDRKWRSARNLRQRTLASSVTVVNRALSVLLAAEQAEAKRIPVDRYGYGRRFRLP